MQMEQQQKLEALAKQHLLPLEHNDRLFFGHYLYRLQVYMYQWRTQDLYSVPTVNWEALRYDSIYNQSFPSQVRRHANKHGDRVRIEAYKHLNYYTNNLDNIKLIIEYVNRINSKHEVVDQPLEVRDIRYFPGTLLERNIRYRKKRLPYGKFQFQILAERMPKEDWNSWRSWAEQYPDKIRLEESNYPRRYGTWSGEPLAYVEDEKMLQLIQFKLGSNIQKIIEYQIKENKENDD